MKKVHPDVFLENLTRNQKLEFIAETNAQMHEYVKPFLNNENVAVAEYEHFMKLPNNLCVCAHADYTKRSGSTDRKIKRVRVFESESEMEFYMMLSEYDNEIDKDSPTNFIFN